MKTYILQRHLGNLGRTVILLIFLLLVILPIYWMFVTSFKTNAEIINAQEITYFPREITTENYVQLFKLYDYKRMLTNSLIVSVSTGLCITLLSILGGYGLARYSFKGKDANAPLLFGNPDDTRHFGDHSVVCDFLKVGNDQYQVESVFLLPDFQSAFLRYHHAKLL